MRAFVMLALCGSILFSGCGSDRNSPVNSIQSEVKNKIATASEPFSGTFTFSQQLNVNYDGRAPEIENPVSTYEQTVTLVQNGTSVSGYVLDEGGWDEDGETFYVRFDGLKGTVLESGNQVYFEAFLGTAGEYNCNQIDIEADMELFQIVGDQFFYGGVNVSEYCRFEENGHSCNFQDAPEGFLPPAPTRCGYDHERPFSETTATLSADGNTLTLWGFEYVRQ